MYSRLSALFVVLSAAVMMQGCAVISVAGAVAGAAISVTGAVVSTSIKAVGAVIPDGDDDEDEDEKESKKD